MRLSSLMDAPTALTLDVIEACIKKDERQFIGTCNTGACNAVQVRSHFQAIYSLAHQRVVGYEALARPAKQNGESISPLTLFSHQNNLSEKVFVDRLCRTLHVKNFVQQHDNNSWLFLNIHPTVMNQGKHFGAFFAEMLKKNNISPNRVVVEVLENQIGNEDLLDKSIQYYRNLGCLIAIDDFGVGQSNFDRIWRLAPQIVKLDRMVIEQVENSQDVRRVLPSFVSLIHQAGSLVLLEGVESEQQAMIALEADIDFVQGYYFARPTQDLLLQKENEKIGHLFEQMRNIGQKEEYARKQQMRIYISEFLEACKGIKASEPIASSLKAFLDLPAVKRCFVLDEQGKQVGENFLPASKKNQDDPRFTPMHDASDAIWSRRLYYRKALEEPGRIQISKPYLSITEGSLCVTLSIAITTPQGVRVLCGDIKPFWLE